MIRMRRNYPHMHMYIQYCRLTVRLHYVSSVLLVGLQTYWQYAQDVLTSYPHITCTCNMNVFLLYGVFVASHFSIQECLKWTFPWAVWKWLSSTLYFWYHITTLFVESLWWLILYEKYDWQCSLEQVALKKMSSRGHENKYASLSYQYSMY